MKALLIIVAT